MSLVHGASTLEVDDSQNPEVRLTQGDRLRVLKYWLKYARSREGEHNGFPTRGVEVVTQLTEGKTLAELGRQFGLSVSRVAQIRDKTYLKLIKMCGPELRDLL